MDRSTRDPDQKQYFYKNTYRARKTILGSPIRSILNITTGAKIFKAAIFPTLSSLYTAEGVAI